MRKEGAERFKRRQVEKQIWEKCVTCRVIRKSERKNNYASTKKLTVRWCAHPGFGARSAWRVAREKGCKGTLRDPVRKPLTEGQASKAAPPRVVVPTRLDESTLSKLQSQVGIAHPVAFNEAVAKLQRSVLRWPSASLQRCLRAREAQRTRLRNWNRKLKRFNVSEQTSSITLKAELMWSPAWIVPDLFLFIYLFIYLTSYIYICICILFYFYFYLFIYLYLFILFYFILYLLVGRSSAKCKRAACDSAMWDVVEKQSWRGWCVWAGWRLASNWKY